MVNSKLRRHKVMERAIKAVMSGNLPPKFKYKDTYESIELPQGYTIPSQQDIEDKFEELLAEEESEPKTAILGDLEVGTANLYVDTMTSNVGIGTSTPGYTLDVHGNANVGTLTATTIAGDGSALSGIQSSNVSDFASNVTRIASVETDLTSNANRIGNLETDLTSNANRIENLETDLTSNANRIASVETDLTSNANRIASVETDLTSNANRIGNLETDLTSNANRIASVETDLTSNATRIGNLETDLTSNVTRIASVETDLTSNANRIASVETDLTSNANRIGNLETDLTSNANRIASVETDLTSNANRIASVESGEHTFTGIKTFENDIVIESNLRIQGDLLVANTINMTVSDPILELGSNNQNTGDVGLVMTRHGSSNSNVAIFFDESADVLKLGYTLNGANDSTLDLDSNALAVNIQGALTAASLSGDGSGLTSLNASNISSGTIADSTGGVKAIYFTNTEQSGYYTDKSGILAFDENFHGDTEYGTGTYDPNTTFVGGNGGGLLIKNEDGWGAIFTSQNTRWAKGYWDTLNVTNTVTASTFSGSGSGLTSLNASNLTSGTVSSDRLSLAASDIPDLSASKITTGTLTRPIDTTTGTFSGRVDSDRYLTSNTFPLPDPNQHSFRHVCMITNSSVPYGLTQAGGCIYEYNPSTGDTVRVVEPVSEPTAGTFNATGGREYFPMGSPMTIVNTQKMVPFTNLGSLFGFIESRYDASTAYLYAPYSNVTVEYFHDTSATGTPTSTIVVPSKTVTTFTCTTAGGTNSHIFVAKGGKILMSSTGNGGDTRVLAPLSTIAYGYNNTNFANDIYRENNVTTSGKCVYSNQNVPLILSQAGDGDGGDGTCGIPFELVADTYIDRKSTR